MSMTLSRPPRIQDMHWEAIAGARDRLNRAIVEGDRSLIVGCCKDLVECVAKVVLEERGQPTGSTFDHPRIITDAHKVLERQAGHGLAVAPGLRGMMTGVRQIATAFAELRNELGTGHGRPFPPTVEDEVLAVAVAGAQLWCNWALNRINHLLSGSPRNLIADLDGFEPFKVGDLAERLIQANLPSLEDADQRQLGVAVGRRAMKLTHNVYVEGVEACVQGDLEMWPRGYRLGLIDGLILDASGQLTMNPTSWQVLQEIASPLPDASDIVSNALKQGMKAPVSPSFIDAWGTFGMAAHTIAALASDSNVQAAVSSFVTWAGRRVKAITG
jgi:hypothetical protein